MNNLELKSNEEVWFSTYLNELKDQNIILSWEYEPKTFLLQGKNSLDFFAGVDKKGNNKYKSVAITREHSYTPDFKIVWNTQYENKFYYLLNFSEDIKTHQLAKETEYNPNIFFYAIYNKETNTQETYIECKGLLNPMVKNLDAKKREAKLNILWTMQLYPVYIQIVETHLAGGIFKNTFTPASIIATEIYKTNDNKKFKYKIGDSKLKFKPVLIDEYLKKLNL